MRYFDKLQARIEDVDSRLCVGLDPRIERHNSEAEMQEELIRLIEHTQNYAAAFKPNMAYFEVMGSKGLQILELILKRIPKNIPVILDAKRSDIGETQKRYAQAYFENWDVDAVTLNPFLGYDSIEPFLDYEEKGVYLLAVTSNKGSKDFQHLLVDGVPLYEKVIAMATKAKEQNALTDVGMVVGLTNSSTELMKVVNSVPLLVPGLGAQGGSIDTISQAANVPTVVNVSRGISYATDDLSYGARAEKWAQLLSRD